MAGDQTKFGVLYFHDANPWFRKMARMSINSLRRFHPDWPVTVVETESLRIQWWRRIYRAVSPWRDKARYDRANQDARMVARKAGVMLDSPYDVTLYLDVDTIVMRPLDSFLAKALCSDVVITPLPWKSYKQFGDDQPEAWPMLMAGVLFYNRRFREVYRPYVERYAEQIPKLPTQEQIILSLACHVEAGNLNVVKEPGLQFDVLNADRHFGSVDHPRVGECVDLSCPELQRFRIFHYNDRKPQYMEQITRVWGITGD